MPGFVIPQLARIRDKPPRGSWLHEIKLDGYRIQTHLNKGRVTIYSRNGHDWTKRLHSLADHFDVPIERAIFDGELVVTKDNRAISPSYRPTSRADARTGSRTTFLICYFSKDSICGHVQ